MARRTLEYGKHSPFSGVFGRPRNLAWPVHAFRVTIPATGNGGQGGLNPFEAVILNMVEAVGGQDSKALSEETCIPIDLVRSIILRLRDRELIDSDNQIMARQQRRRDRDQDDDFYTSALAFRELVGGEVLPFVHVLDASNPIRTKETEPKARILDIEPNACGLGAPSTRAVIDAIIQMKRRATEHGHYIRIPTIEQVRVGREPEEFLLDCRIAVETRSAEFRIADPFGIGFSRLLEHVFASRLEDDESLQRWMRNWLETLANPNQDSRQPPMATNRFDTPSNRRRYPKLVQTLTPARGFRHRSVTDIYASLEWSFFYTCEAYEPSIAIRQLRAEVGPGYSRRMAALAASIGFEVPEYGFRPVPRGRLADYDNRKAEMDTVIAIALLQAESDEDHPMHRLAKVQPDLFVNIRKLESDRGSRAHGAHVPLRSEVELASDAMMRDTISTLLPSVQFDDGGADAPAESEADLLLDARISLIDTFGYRPFRMLGPDTQNALLEAEKFLLASHDGDDARELVVNLYAALQGALRGFLGGATPLGLTESDYKKAAWDRARRAGLGDLPQGMRSVNPRRIREALQGIDRSLGASALVMLLTTSENRLAALARQQPSFLTDIGTIHERRGHGNEPLPMSTVDARNLRRITTLSLETLLELAEED